MPEPTPPTIIPSAGGEVVITTPRQQELYDTWKYAPARRGGDYIYVSGVVISRAPDGLHTAEAFATQARLAFLRIEVLLQAFGAGFADVVMINSFHDWAAPEFAGARMAQFEAFRDVKDEFMPQPHAACTAVGTSGLIRPEGIVEVQMIAYQPQPSASA